MRRGAARDQSRGRPGSEKSDLLLARAVTLAVGIGAIAFALTIDSLIDILILAYTYWAPVMVPPLAATILGIRRSTGAFLAAAAAGAATALAWNMMLGKPADVEGFVVGALANAAVLAAARAWRARAPAGRRTPRLLQPSTSRPPSGGPAGP